jgi:hypothetical protein
MATHAALVTVAVNMAGVAQVLLTAERAANQPSEHVPEQLLHRPRPLSLRNPVRLRNLAHQHSLLQSEPLPPPPQLQPLRQVNLSPPTVLAAERMATHAALVTVAVNMTGVAQVLPSVVLDVKKVLVLALKRFFLLFSALWTFNRSLIIRFMTTTKWRGNEY